MCVEKAENHKNYSRGRRWRSECGRSQGALSLLFASSLPRIHTTHTHCANVKESCFTVSMLMHFYVLFKVLLAQTILKYMSCFLLFL